MPRPLKQGLDYFALDCNVDNKVRALIGKYKASGFGVFIHLLQLIYNNGYYLKRTSEVIEDIAIEMSVDESFVDEIIAFACKRNIFSDDAYGGNILTSHGIQKRFTEATKRRKEFNIVDEYRVNVNNNLINVNNNHTETPVNADIGTQRKGKERKEEESIGAGANLTLLIEDIYLAYPKPCNEINAQRAIARALKEIDGNELLEIVKKYSMASEWQEQAFIPNPDKWFEGKRWKDDPKTWEKPKEKKDNGQKETFKPEDYKRGAF